MIYPIVIAAMSVVTVVVLAVFVLPKFKDFFTSLDAKLPLPTRMLLGFTDFLTTLVVGARAADSCALVVLLGGADPDRARASTRGTRFLLKVPVLGATIQYALVERFCRVLASMVERRRQPSRRARAWRPSRCATASTSSALGAGDRADARGRRASPLRWRAPGCSPTTASQMLRVGEDTGSLDTQLEITAQYYEVELDYKIKKLTALFEPASSS